MSSQAGPQAKPSKTHQAKFWGRVVLGALALAAILWFIVANSQSVTVNWFVVETHSRLWLVILLAAVLGALIDRAIRWRRDHKG